jgi:hypothetical protein
MVRSTTHRRGSTVKAGMGGGSTSMGYHPQRRGRSTISKGPAALLRYPGTELLAAIGHVSPDVLQPIEGHVGRGEQPRRRLRISQIGGVDEDTQQETRRLNEEMALAAVEFLGAIIPVRPPFSVVFTVCASMIAAEGCG